MNLQITKATAENTQLIYQLAEKIWNVHYVPIIGQAQVDYMLARMYSHDALLDQMVNQGQDFYLIYKDSMPIGFFSISGDQNMFIHKFYVDQSNQGQGIGSKIFEQIRALNPQAKTYTLTVNRQNYKAINFYFKNGFVIDRVEDFDIGDGYFMNDFIMIWK